MDPKTKPNKTSQPSKLSHKQNQSQNNLKEGEYVSFAQTFRPLTNYCTFSWTTESFIFCTDVNIKLVLTDPSLFNCIDFPGVGVQEIDTVKQFKQFKLV